MASLASSSEPLPRSQPKVTVKEGMLCLHANFQRETIFQRLLHNETAIAIQNRLQWLGFPMLVLPIRVWGEGKKISAGDLTHSISSISGTDSIAAQP